ncbi:4'-phosphopantetheinyl transferase family protein [Agarilytica rhodophyticola]|uniref:4'-phosphopantetheinyl transferase family protein n=1 Tax=Agarilytica rhodophyticola TaxID=1737490 RepID=UPI000CD999D5|nr:hypothetical protein [Agarilytica rhodophyticola]
MSSVVELYYLPIDSDGFDIDLDDALPFLDEQESDHYFSYKSERPQAVYLQTRRILKTVLARKVGCWPGDIKFSSSKNNKLSLKNTPHYSFDISHNNSSIVIALARTSGEIPISIDVKDIAMCKKNWPKAEIFLSGYTKKFIDRCSSDQQRAEFFAEHWSCIESYIKLKNSTMYSEKNRVKIKFYSDFSLGKRYLFEDVCFTVFHFSDQVCISLASAKVFPNINVIHWRSGEEKIYYSHAEPSSVNSIISSAST